MRASNLNSESLGQDDKAKQIMLKAHLTLISNLDYSQEFVLQTNTFIQIGSWTQTHDRSRKVAINLENLHKMWSK